MKEIQDKPDSPVSFNVSKIMQPPPNVIPPIQNERVSVIFQFIIPYIHFSKKNKDIIRKIVDRCTPNFYEFEYNKLKNNQTNQQATLISIGYYIEKYKTEKENNNIAIKTSHLISERFLGLLSFCYGIKCSKSNPIITLSYKSGEFQAILPAISKNISIKINEEFPKEIWERPEFSDNLFSSLFWLRRGLAERDPLETYSSLMVCLQILAKILVDAEKVEIKCPKCKYTIKKERASITNLVRMLVIEKLGEDPELFKRIWKVRNATVAHGNESITSEIILEITDLKFDAARLAFKGIKLALGIPIVNPPDPNQVFFITDGLMYFD